MISKSTIYELEKEKKRLEKIIRDAEKELGRALPGSIQIKAHGNGVQFYHRKNGEKNGEYIPVADRKRVISLVQKRYLTKLLVAAKKQKRAFDDFFRYYDQNALEKVYDAEGAVRQLFITPAELPEEQFIDSWEAVEYSGKEFREDTPVHYTQRHERVRSKSEMMIANALFHAKIPYRYECPLELGGNLVHPDFTILRMRDRKQIYWEHLGMVDDPEYRNQAFQKLRIYEANGIFPGSELILTMESYRCPLNMKIVDQMIQHYIL